MNTNITKVFIHAIGILVVFLSLVLAPAIVKNVSAVSVNSTPAEVGFIDHTFGQAVKAEPTADVAESKLWWNDGFWWGILFDPASSTYRIHWLDWGTQSWRSTSTALDSRKDDTGLVATRFDVLWDEEDQKLYIASHIKISNPSQVNDSLNWGRLYRYSYNPSTKRYTLDSSNFPVTVNTDKTESLVLDKDSEGRLWVTYVSRVPTDDSTPQEYHVYINYTETPGNDHIWANPIKMGSISNQGTVVGMHDVSTVIAFGSRVGLMWSNGLNGSFYFADHPATSSPTSNWTVQAINISPFTLFANDHIKPVANSTGQVFATVKTLNQNPTDPLLGVIARDVNGAFSFHTFSDVSSVDTRPTLLLDESQNRLVMFASSNATGGVICYKPMAITNPLSAMQFAPGNCSTQGTGAPRFIVSSQYPNIDNPTTSKRNVNNNTGIVVLATDDKNGSAYLHNVMGNPLAVITDTVPAQGATVTHIKLIIMLTFSHNLNPDTLNSNNLKVRGPNGEVQGTITYNAATRTATFSAPGNSGDGTYRVELNAGVRDASGRPLYKSGEVLEVLRFQISFLESTNLYLPLISR